jgi:probable HAF family extracellular repeat protein
MTQKRIEWMAAFSPAFRLYRRREIILSGGNMKSMFIFGASLMTSLAMAQSATTTYSVQDLGVLGGAPGSPYFMANNGLIAGAAGTANNQSHAAVWFMGFKLDLATPGLGGPNSIAYSVNSKGQVVGAAENTTANSEDFCGFNANGIAKSSNDCLPFVFQNGVMTKLPTLGGPNGIAYWINNHSEAVGWAETVNQDPNPACGVLQFQPVLWGTSSTRTLPTFPGDPDGVAAAINDNGQVVGATGTCGTFNVDSGLFLVEKHAMLWEAGAAINLGNLGGDGLFGGHHACAINNRGQVVGHSDLTGDTTFHTFLWTWETGMKDIGTLPGDFASTAISINDTGVVVGVSLDSNFNERAFVWSNGSMTDLNAVLTSNPQKLYLLQANSINAEGDIVGLASTASGDLHGFLAMPDSAGNALPLDRTASPTPLSDDARKTILRRIGIRKK